MSVAARAAREPALRRLLAAAGRRYRELGGVRGRARLTDLSDDEARALAGLGVTGRSLPRAGGTVSVDLARLDAALREPRAGGGLALTLELAGEDTTTRDRREAARMLDERKFWSSFAADPACADERVKRWLEGLSGRPPLAGLARTEQGAALRACLAALAEIGCARRPLDRAVLARVATGDPHALDDGRPAATLLLSALADREGLPRVPTAAGGRRALLARHGVVSDPLSSTVLVLGLRATGDGPAARVLAAVDGGHALLTLDQVLGSRLRAPARRVFATEGPIVTRAAEAKLGYGSSPLICTDGQPSAACAELLRQLVAGGARVRHSGDFDWGGLRIAGLMRRRQGARPWRHASADYARLAERLGDRAGRLEPPRGAPPEGFGELWAGLAQHRVPVWQEDLLDELVGDLAG